MKAEYSPENLGHFGLSAKYYCHFTSPIRRYPDLIAHRMLQKALTGEEFTAADENMCAEAAQQSTSREQAADNCERDIDKLFIAAYMKQFIGEEFDAAVSGVSRFGVFCRTEMLCEGLIPAISLGDVTEYNERTFTLTVNTGRGVRVFRLGERLKVRAEAADAISAKITFSLVEP